LHRQIAVQHAIVERDDCGGLVFTPVLHFYFHFLFKHQKSLLSSWRCTCDFLVFIFNLTSLVTKQSIPCHRGKEERGNVESHEFEYIPSNFLVWNEPNLVSGWFCMTCRFPVQEAS
jgi:hypothetical protein